MHRQGVALSGMATMLPTSDCFMHPLHLLWHKLGLGGLGRGGINMHSINFVRIANCNELSLVKSLGFNLQILQSTPSLRKSSKAEANTSLYKVELLHSSGKKQQSEENTIEPAAA